MISWVKCVMNFKYIDLIWCHPKHLSIRDDCKYFKSICNFRKTRIVSHSIAIPPSTPNTTSTLNVVTSVNEIFLKKLLLKLHSAPTFIVHNQLNIWNKTYTLHTGIMRTSEHEMLQNTQGADHEDIDQWNMTRWQSSKDCSSVIINN